MTEQIKIGRICWQAKPDSEIHYGQYFEFTYIQKVLKNDQQNDPDLHNMYKEYVEEVINPTIEQLGEAVNNMNNIFTITESVETELQKFKEKKDEEIYNNMINEEFNIISIDISDIDKITESVETELQKFKEKKDEEIYNKMINEEFNMISIDISDIDKVLLLKAMWENSKPALFFDTHTAINHNIQPPIFDKEKAIIAVLKYIDYYDGRYINTDLSENTVNPTSYDREYGQGKLQQIINNLRKK